jgi:hypothetical protein
LNEPLGVPQALILQGVGAEMAMKKNTQNSLKKSSPPVFFHGPGAKKRFFAPGGGYFCTWQVLTAAIIRP